jgi:hypothetical protein
MLRLHFQAWAGQKSFKQKVGGIGTTIRVYRCGVREPKDKTISKYYATPHSSSWWRMLRGSRAQAHRFTRLIIVGPSARARLVGGRPAYDLTSSRCR